MSGRLVGEVATTLAALNADEWNAFLPGEAYYAATPWLLAAERTAPAGGCRYLTVRDADTGALRALTVGHVLAADSPFAFSRPDAVFERRDPASLLPSLTLGGRNPSHSQVVVGRTLPPEVAAAARRAVLDLAEDAARVAGCRSLAVLYVDGSDPLDGMLAGAGWERTGSGPAAVLEVVGTSFDDYLAGLPARRRETVRRDLRRCAAAGTEVVVRPLVESLVPDLISLETNLYAKYGTPYRPDVMLRLYGSLAVAEPRSAYVVLTTVAGGLAGFALFFHWRDVIHARSTGYDYAVTRDVPVYFQTLYYALIEYAIRHDVRQIRYSTGLVEVKLSRGCTAMPQTAYVRDL